MTQKLTSHEKETLQIYNKKELTRRFIEACKNGHLELVQYLLTSKELDENADIHGNNDEGFHLALKHSRLDVVEYLLTSPELTEHVVLDPQRDFITETAKANYLNVRFLLTLPEVQEYLKDDNNFNNEINKIVQYGLEQELLDQLIEFNPLYNFQATPYNIDWAIRIDNQRFIYVMMNAMAQQKTVPYSVYLDYFEKLDKTMDRYLFNTGIFKTYDIFLERFIPEITEMRDTNYIKYLETMNEMRESHNHLFRYIIERVHPESWVTSLDM